MILKPFADGLLNNGHHATSRGLNLAGWTHKTNNSKLSPYQQTLRDLVEHDHAWDVVGQRFGQQPKGRAPVARRFLGEHASAREGGGDDGVE